MSAGEHSKPAHLEPSQLGTKEYWDNLYTTEITNHTLDPSDEGTIWFDDSAAEDKVVAALEKWIEDEGVLGEGIGKVEASVIDLGTGNGHFLGRLREEEEWGGRLLGVDYSEKSVEFARRIWEEKVEFREWDVLRGDLGEVQQEGDWDVVVDKGTFDAISLSEELDERGRRICEGYKERIMPLLKVGGLFLVTSCNWTEEELRGWFEGQELEVWKVVEYKSFSFGGRKGQTVCSVCFRKVG